MTCTSAVLGLIASALAAAASAARICAARSSYTYMLTSHMGIGEAQKRADVVLVEPERRLEEATSLPRRLERQGLVPCRPAVEGVIKGIEAFGMLERCAPALCGDEFDVDGTGQSDGDLFLRVEEVGIWFVEAFGPKMRAALGVDELGTDPDPVARALHAAFENVTRAELEADLANIDRPALVAAGGVARNHEEAGNAGEIGRRRSVTPSTK